MQIRYEYLSESYPRFWVYRIQEWEKIQQFFLHDKFSKILDKTLEYPKQKHVFLLDESRFSFFRFDIFLDTKKNITIQDLQDLIDKKIDLIEHEHGVQWKFLATYIDSIFVDWEEKTRVIWSSWSIFFRLYIIYMDMNSFNEFKSVYWSWVQENPHIKILPQSFHTTLFLRNNFKKRKFYATVYHRIFSKNYKNKK